MLKIYGAPHSRAFRVIWLANEIGIPYEHIPVTFDPPNPQCKEPWYVALNPNGRVPSIDDDGFVMWESAAIRRTTTMSGLGARTDTFAHGEPFRFCPICDIGRTEIPQRSRLLP
jgi:hypothetical protein